MAEDQAAAIVREVQQKLEDAWRAGDGQAFAAVFAEDADYVNIVGMYARGRPAIAGMHQHIFDHFYTGGTARFETERARFLTGDLILAQAATEVQVASGAAQGVVRGFTTMLLARSDGAWRIESFQNTRREATD